MWSTLSTYWPYILASLSVVMASAAIIHAVMTKEEVRAAIGWVGVILLSPILGALVYAIAGINRVRRASIASERRRAGYAVLLRLTQFDVPRALVADLFGEPFGAMKTLGDRVTKHSMTSGNAIRVLRTATRPMQR